MLDVISATLILLNAYFFCFEVKRVNEQIRSKSYHEYIIRDKRILKIRKLFMIVAIVIRIYGTVILARRFILDDLDDWSSPWIIAYLVSGLIRLIMDVYIFFSTFKHFLYIVKKRI